MKDLSAYYEIARLITAELSETITPEEKGRLNVWLAEDERHYMRYCRIRERLKRGEGENVFRNPERVREDMEKLKKKLSGNKRRFLLSGNYFWRYGAVAVFTIGIAIGLIERPWEDRSSEMSPMAQQPAVLPGSYKAVLTLASGEQVNLEEWCRDSLWKDGTLIRKRKGELTYEQKAGDMQQEEMLFNTITIPRSGEYKLVLSDGTKVWLNSASKLKYPVAFTGGQRKVFLEGEAYFKVAKNEKQPFVVKTENMDVRVLGTEFNLKAYADEKWVQATLVRGEVAVFTGMDKSVRNTLKPEQQAEWDIEKGKLDVKTVELDLYIAWKNGQFVFRGQRLTEIMTVLERWYDFEVCYQADWIKEVEFAGKLNRSASIEPILDVIRSTHKINVNTRGKTIVFSAKQ
mgnify:CR=1 FL=1